jgi:D-arabinose 1-dehydrogenase-like Zn-dependent alcohol dehydrogenase
VRGVRALVYDSFRGPMTVREVPNVTAPSGGVVVRVGATGVCRSDWHGWHGHDADITSFPHVPGHELAGTVASLGVGVERWKVGDRVTVPFINACGTCRQCREGDQQVCAHQRQPGFTHWGSMAQLVALDAADVNLVRLPDAMSFATAASLGCRYATAYRAVVQQGRIAADEWVAVFGCGGVGLAAVQIAAAFGAQVVAVDTNPAALVLAADLGAHATIQAGPSVAPRVHEATDGGAHLTIDAFGSVQTCLDALASLRPRGRHVQVGLMPGGPAPIPMGRVLSQELEIVGSHGLAAHFYPDLLALVTDGTLRPDLLITREISLDEAAKAIEDVGQVSGVTVVTSF